MLAVAACVRGAVAFSAPTCIFCLDGKAGAHVAPLARRQGGVDGAIIGRYIKEFCAYSDRYPLGHKLETPEIAIELSLQPFRAFSTDGVIIFSDILTPLPSMGII